MATFPCDGEQGQKSPPKPTMKIAVISKSDQFGGGASRVASELAELLNAAGHPTDHWLSWAGSPWREHMRALYGPLQFPVRAANLLLRRIGFPELIPFELTTLLHRGQIWEYDLIHFHDLSSAISPLSLLWLSRRKPVVWTIHDCSPFTGGCLYPMDCRQFESRCGKCPQLGGWPIDSKFDFTGFQQDLKRRLAASGRIHYVTPSAWMAKCACASGMFRPPPQVVSNGIDTDVFRPHDKATARREIGIPLDRTVVLLSAGSLLDERKGIRFGIDALHAVRGLRPFVLLVGNPNPKILEQLAGFDIHDAGYIADGRNLSRHYAAADLFLFTSLADNQPLTVLETMATGTPIVGFHTGGIPEMVIQGQTGFLVPQRDSNALAETLARALSNPDLLLCWKVKGVEHVGHYYSHRHFLASHVALYEKLIASAAHMPTRGARVGSA